MKENKLETCVNKSCFICFCARTPKTDCCFANGEAGLKKCRCGRELPKNDHEFFNYNNVHGNKK